MSLLYVFQLTAHFLNESILADKRGYYVLVACSSLLIKYLKNHFIDKVYERRESKTSNFWNTVVFSVTRAIPNTFSFPRSYKNKNKHAYQCVLPQMILYQFGGTTES